MKRAIAIMIAAAAMLSMYGCSADTDSASSVQGLISQAPAAPMKPVEEFKGTYFDTDIWEAMHIQTAEDIAAGYENSEACQACMYVTLDPIDGKIGYYGTDCGGIYRTEDGGKSWTPANIGYQSFGGACAAIDPNNVNRAVMVGANTGLNKDNGLHLTTDAGKTWKATYMPGDEGFEGQLSAHEGEGEYYGYDYRIQVAYDETTADDEIGGSAVVYWTREDCSRAEDKNKPSLYKSTDGGETWAKLPNTEQYAGGYIVVHPKDGRVAVSNKNGAWVSSDGGESFTKVSDLQINALVGVRTRPDNLYALTNDGLYVSYDFGSSFKKVTEQMPSRITRVSRLRVSPSNPDRMVMFYRGEGDWNFKTFYTENGGKTWSESRMDKSGIFIPMNSWNAVCWFSPVDENYIIANEYRSENGGADFFVSTKGFNAILVGGHYSINVNDSSLMSFASQDFNGGYSTDGGKTWKYISWSGKGWGGYAYGAYAMTKDIIVAAPSPSWWVTGELCYTKDGGKTVVRTGLAVDGQRVGYGVVGKENICFLAEYRTDDYCDTWTKMNGCTAVFTHDPKTGRLFGANGFEIVYSDDDGVTWTKLSVTASKVEGMAYNSETGILYACSGGSVLSVDTSKSQVTVAVDAGFKISGAKDICLDPENPNLMYVISNGSKVRDYSVKRTLDGGKTWTQLRRQVGDGRDNCPDGGYGSCIVFNSATREIITCGACRGIWKMKAPNIDNMN